MVRRRSDDVFRIFKSLQANYPITKLSVSTKAVLDVQQIESIESTYNRIKQKNHDFQKFITVGRAIRNTFEQGLTKTMSRLNNMAGLAGVIASDLGDTEEDLDELESE